jgi:hypothetical protein
VASTISIFLTGLCYLVNNGAGKTLNVVFPNVVRERIAETKHHGGAMIIPSHRTYVRYRVDQVIASDTMPQIFFTRHGVNYAAYFLNGEAVEVAVSADGAQAVSFATTAANPSSPPSKNDRLPFDKIVNLKKEVHTSCGYINPNHLTPKRRDVVQGRLDIVLGSLAASFADPKALWEFKPDPLDSTERYLAQAVAWDLKTTDGRVTLNFSPFLADDPVSHYLTLGSIGGPLDLEIGNAPIADVVGAGQRHSPDHHFEVYYGLLQARPVHLPIPHRKDLYPDGANCPPVQETP